MSLTSPYKQHNYIGEYLNEASALAYIQANKWDSNGDGTGNPQPGMLYFNTTDNRIYVRSGTSWSAIGGGAGSTVFAKGVQFTQTVVGSSNATGSVNLGLVEGNVYWLFVEMTSGTTTDADVEFAAADLGGAPDKLYQIGYNAGDPIWNPSDGDWLDANPWGFVGLPSTGILYWRLTNNGAGSMDFRVTIRAIGTESAVSV